MLFEVAAFTGEGVLHFGGLRGQGLDHREPHRATAPARNFSVGFRSHGEQQFPAEKVLLACAVF